MNSHNLTSRGIGKAHTGSYFHNLTTTAVPKGEVQFALDDVLCDETMTSLRHCSHLPWGKHNCKANEIAGVTCLESLSMNDLLKCKFEKID